MLMGMPDELAITFSRDEMIEKLRVDPAFAVRLWSAFGFGDDPSDLPQFTADDEAALGVYVGTDRQLDPVAQLAAARVIGQSTARLAEWQAVHIRALAEDPDNELSRDELVDALQRIQELVWRRHLENYLRYEDRHTTEEADAEGTEVVIGFADIVGYTSLTRRLGLHELEDLLETFESAAHQVVTGHDGQVIKTIGDAVMFTASTPADAAEIALRLHGLASDGALPTLRIGLASGIALNRMGDVYGEPVNIAARLAGVAREGATLIDENLADQLADEPEFHVGHTSSLSVRGYRRLRAHPLVRNKNAPSVRSANEAAEQLAQAEESRLAAERAEAEQRATQEKVRAAERAAADKARAVADKVAERAERVAERAAKKSQKARKRAQRKGPRHPD